MKKKIKLIKSIKLMDHIDDIAMGVGSVSLFYGISKIYSPAAFIMLGICCYGYAYLYAKRRWK